MPRMHEKISLQSIGALNAVRAKIAVDNGDDPINLNRTQFEYYITEATNKVRRMALEQGVPIGEANQLVNRYRKQQEARWRREAKRLKGAV